MSPAVYDDLALERLAKERFGMNVEVESVILRRVDVSRTAKATVFLTAKRQLLLYIEASSPLLLADVKKLVSRMGMKAEMYMPPKGQPHYFDDIGRSKFLEVFPGRSQISNEDIQFYRTLAPYNPALFYLRNQH